MDADAQGIPNYVEVLSHYEVAIWYTGDDYIPRVPNGLQTHQDEVLAFREFINHEEGKLFATGQANLAWLSAVAAFSSEFFQYYLGAYIDIDTGGMDATTGSPSDVKGDTGDSDF